ncbi:MAG: glycosyltransferase family 87 protein [Anaeromyxobacteraceae bacterium]
MPLSAPPSRALRRGGLVALGVALAALAARATVRPGVDFGVFHAAGARFRAGLDLYLPPAQFPYRYAPAVAALFAPFATLPFPLARAVWAAVNAAIVLGVAIALDRRLGSRAPLAVPLSWALLAQPLAQELSYGQVDLLVLALALTAFELDRRGHEVTGGALVAAAAALKVAPAVLAVDWAVRRRWRPFAGAAVAGAVLAAVTAARYGVPGALEQHAHWYATQSSDVQYMVDALRNQSLWAMSRTLGLGNAGGALASLGLIALAASARGRRRQLVLLAAIPLVSGYGWPQLFILAVPLLAETIAAGGATAWIAACATGAVSLASYDVAGPRVEDWVYGHRVAGVLLTIAVVCGRFAPVLGEARAPSSSPGAPATAATASGARRGS